MMVKLISVVLTAMAIMMVTMTEMHLLALAVMIVVCLLCGGRPSIRGVTESH